MKMKLIFPICICLTIVILINSCTKDNVESTANDKNLYSAISSASGYTYYRATPTITSAQENSPHSFERVRFNSIAASSLDSSGKLPVGSNFLNGAIIVKEIYTSINGSINQFAVMKKDPTNNGASNGYLWAEFKTDGTVTYSTANKGKDCTGCHSGSTNRDFIRTFDLH